VSTPLTFSFDFIAILRLLNKKTDHARMTPGSVSEKVSVGCRIRLTICEQHRGAGVILFKRPKAKSPAQIF
jgi:hypothetical protein